MSPMSPTDEPESVEEKVVRRRKRREEEILSPTLPPEESTAMLEKMTRRRRRNEVASPWDELRVSEIPTEEEKREHRERRRRSQKSRPNVSEQNVQLADGQRVPESEVDAGLFESLMSKMFSWLMGKECRNLK